MQGAELSRNADSCYSKISPKKYSGCLKYVVPQGSLWNFLGVKMHLGRFHSAIEMLADEYRSIQHPQLLTNVINALNSVAGNPGNPDVAIAYKAQLDACKKALQDSTLNHPRPVLKSLLESIGAPEFIGDRLFSRVMSALNSNPAAAALAAQELQRLQQSTQIFYDNVGAIDKAFTTLKVEYDYLDEGEGELGIVLPKVDGKSSLKDLSKEFREWGNALAPLAEIFDPNAGPLQIKTCATTDWTLFLVATPPILGGISLCLKGINSILRELVEGRELIEKLVKRSAPNAAIEVLEADGKDKLDREIRRLADETVDKHGAAIEEGRKNELKNALDGSLKVLAHKITQGAKLEMRLVPLERSSENVSENEIGNVSPEQLEMETLADQFDREVDLLDFSSDIGVIAGLLEPPSTTEV
jgi:hypothetical protein